jgi:hypothetical protein
MIPAAGSSNAIVFDNAALVGAPSGWRQTSDFDSFHYHRLTLTAWKLYRKQLMAR